MPKMTHLSVSTDVHNQHPVPAFGWETGTCMKMILETSPMGILLIDRNGVVITCSRSFGGIAGIPREQAAGLPAFDWMIEPPIDKRFLQRMLAKGGTYEFPGMVCRRKCDGAVRRLDLRIESLCEEGEPVGAIFFVMEARETFPAAGESEGGTGRFPPSNSQPVNLEVLSRIVARSALDIHHNMRKILGRDSEAGDLEMLSQIVNQSSHDFNNMLAPLTTYPELIRMHYHDRDRVMRYLQAIETAAMKIADRNRDLLMLGRRRKSGWRAVDVNAVIARIFQESRCPDTLVLDRRLTPDLFPIDGRPEEIERLIVHLLKNARAAMGDRGVVTVKTENYYLDHSVRKYRVASGGEFIKITVSDTGPGIGGEILGRIWDPAAFPDDPGNCLGLKVACSVVKDHRGYLDAETREGKGTSFFIYLPIARKDGGEGLADCRRGKGERILLIDDDPDQLELYRRILSDLGYHVRIAQSAGEAIAACPRLSFADPCFDLLVMDVVRKNGTDGLHEYRAVRDVFPDQKSILLSGFAPADQIKELQRLGAGPHLRKPVQAARLSQAVRETLDSASGETLH